MVDDPREDNRVRVGGAGSLLQPDQIRLQPLPDASEKVVVVAGTLAVQARCAVNLGAGPAARDGGSAVQIQAIKASTSCAHGHGDIDRHNTLADRSLVLVM